MDAAGARRLILQHWRLDADVTPLGGGMNSETWHARAGDGRWVLKRAVRVPGFDLSLGLVAATRLDAAGVPTGPAEPTVSGALLVEDDSALLRFVDGVPLGTDDASREDDVRALDVEPWVRSAVTSAVEAWRDVDVRTWAVLHGDPAPEAFLRTPDGIGLIDWGGAFRGPCLYDLASAVMYVGHDARDDLVASYLTTAPMPVDEVAGGLEAALQLRWAVQAWYFAGRVTADDRTGLDDDPGGNRKGLADARRWLGA